MIVRSASPLDAPAMTAILNAVIAIGGTTAHQSPKTEAQVRRGYIDGPDVLSSVVAVDQERVIGWQAVELWQGDPHIGTFVRPGLQTKGAGTAMFTLTCDLLRAKSVAHVIAFIRADNAPGLAYYARVGFRDLGHDPGFALSDGRIVGRIHRRFDL
jgi:L-amino acid N-acyltransferase YncA